MSRHPLKTTSKKTEVVSVDQAGAVEVSTPVPRTDGFFSFRYTYTEVWSQGGRTRVKAKQARLEDGKLSTEAFEGELGPGVYDQAVRQAQRLVLDQMAWVTRSLSWLLPPMRGRRSDRE